MIGLHHFQLSSDFLHLFVDQNRYLAELLHLFVYQNRYLVERDNSMGFPQVGVATLDLFIRIESVRVQMTVLHYARSTADVFPEHENVGKLPF